VRFVELVTQARYSTPGHHGGVPLDAPGSNLGRFHLGGDFVDVGVQRVQQLSRLRRVGVIDHVRIIPSAPAKRAPRPRKAGRWSRRESIPTGDTHLAAATIPQ
jgi:hypothetical protein